jgi:hypothetical protein
MFAEDRNFGEVQVDPNHNQTAARSLKVRTSLKAGLIDPNFKSNHNQIVARGLKIKSGVKAGVIDPNI